MIDQRNFHQSPEEIIKNASAEQRILWNRIFLLCGDKLSISQLHFQGPIPTDFTTYRARRIFLAYQLTAGGGSVSVNYPFLTLYDENNVANFILSGCDAYWNTTTTAAVFCTKTCVVKNVYFSRLVNSNFTSVVFVGFRIIY